MIITVTFDNQRLRVNGQVLIGQLKIYIQQKFGIPVAEQLLHEQERIGRLRDNMYIQDLEDIENLGLRMELGTREYYTIKLIVSLPDTLYGERLQLNGRFRRFGRLVLVRKACSFITKFCNITLRVNGNRVLDNDEYLFRFDIGTVITCTVD